MKYTRFPVTVGLIALPASSVSAQTVTVVRELLGKLQERSPSGVTLILPNYQQLSEAFSSMSTETGVRVVRLDPPANQISSNEFSIVDLSDVVIAITGADVDVIDRDPVGALAYAQQLGRPTLTVDAQTGAMTGTIPEQLDVDQGWLPELFQSAGIPPDADLETIKAKMSALANRSAPLTRSKWNWVVFVQGL